jgi:hypothetical protein
MAFRADTRPVSPWSPGASSTSTSSTPSTPSTPGPFRSGYVPIPVDWASISRPNQWNNYLNNAAVTNRKQYASAINRMVKAGLINKGATLFQANNAWGYITDFVRSSQRQGNLLGKTPLDAIEIVGSLFSQSGGGSGGGGGGGNGTYTQTQKSVNLSSAKDAKALINQSFQQSVGRDATDDEIKKFRKALNSEEKKNPTITKTTNVVSGSNQSSTSKTTGGMDRGAYSDEQSKQAEDYAEFQTETTYMDALMRAISGGA